jgi:uncharacterized membrane protein
MNRYDDGHHIVIKSEIGNNHKKKSMMFLPLAIVLSLFSSLYVLTIMVVDAQAYRSSRSIPSSSTNDETRVTEMGICVVGTTSPCNGVT